MSKRLDQTKAKLADTERAILTVVKYWQERKLSTKQTNRQLRVLNALCRQLEAEIAKLER